VFVSCLKSHNILTSQFTTFRIKWSSPNLYRICAWFKFCIGISKHMTLLSNNDIKICVNNMFIFSIEVEIQDGLPILMVDVLWLTYSSPMAKASSSL